MTLYDPGVFKHPYTGETIPVRTTWKVESAGPNGNLTVPSQAIIWDPSSQSWKDVGDGTMSTSKVTFDLSFSNWHHGEPMNLQDVLYSLYFTLEWGSESDENDNTFDQEYSPTAQQLAQSIIGINLIDENTVEIYVNYWHFDEGEIASWASVWADMPWELIFSMEQSVLNNQVSFSRSGAVSNDVNWLSLIVPNDAKLIETYLDEGLKSQKIPEPLEKFVMDFDEISNRYMASKNWIQEKNHAVISNGPFHLDYYSPESRTISISAFRDDTYQFEPGFWSEFEDIKFPKVVDVTIPEVVKQGNSMQVDVFTENSSILYYFFTSASGRTVESGSKEVIDNYVSLNLDNAKTEHFELGANNLKLFTISDKVLRPDIFRTSFFVVEPSGVDLPSYEISAPESGFEGGQDFFVVLVVILIIVGIGSVAIYKIKKRKKERKILKN